ncbi:unnamed protein product [Gongylonema pulchrum]|uniref:Ovule protein n=1 Tax=Gongylonema pulchrum TaxID=637853 RepID=A0A183DP29_9BILA|nr:unnamed protein product [Gongylonema pulchrum]
MERKELLEPCFVVNNDNTRGTNEQTSDICAYVTCIKKYYKKRQAPPRRFKVRSFCPSVVVSATRRYRK